MKRKAPSRDGRITVDVAERLLPNGLRLLAVRNPDVRTFAAAVSLDVDRRVEARTEEGLAYLVGACLDEGTKRYDNIKLAEAVDALGGRLGGSSAGGSVECPVVSASKALGLLRQIVCEPTFPDREVSRVQQEILVDIKNEQDDPATVAHRGLSKKIYGRHRIARPAHGTASLMAAFRPADLRDFHSRWFVPEGGVVVASGPEEPGEMLDRLARVFGVMRGRAPERPKQPAIPARTASRVIKRMRREQVHVYAGHLGIRRVHTDFHGLQVLDHVLGSAPGFTSRISRRLRDEQGLCYSVYASITASAGREPGVFEAYIGTSPQHREAALDGFAQEMRRLQRRAPSADEVADAQSYLIGSYPLQLQRSSDLVRYAVRCHYFGLDFDYAGQRAEALRAITPAEVQRLAREHLDPDSMAISIAGPLGTGT